MEKAKQLISPAPMPEDPVDARLAGLLVPAPHVVPEKKAKKVAAGTRKSSPNQVSDDEAESRVAERSGEREERMGACGAEAWPETFYKAFHRVAD